MTEGELKPEAALQQLKKYCAYQERCHAEVRNKLFALEVRARFHEEIIAALVTENYLNEERFAVQFAGGHFRTKQWGRVKIKYALKQKQVSDYCIRVALKAIDEDDYRRTLEKLARAKLNTLRSEKLLPAKKKKLSDFLLRKGFEPQYVSTIVHTMLQ